MLEELGHRFLDKFIGDALFGLVFVRSLGGEGGGNQHKAVLHVLKGDLALVFQILALLLQKGVDLGNEGALHRFFRCAAMLQMAGVVVVFQQLDPIGKTAGDLHLHLVFRLVLTVTALAAGLPVLHAGQSLLAGQLFYIVGDTVFVAELGGLKAFALLILKDEQQPGVDHRLPFQHLGVILHRDGDIGKHIQIGLPADAGAGLFLGSGLFHQSADVFALFKAQIVFVPVTEDLNIHILCRVLGGAQTQTVETQGILVALALVGLVLAAGI